MSLAYSEYHLGLQNHVLLVCLYPGPGLTNILFTEYVEMWLFTVDMSEL